MPEKQPCKTCETKPDLFAQWRDTMSYVLGHTTGEIIFCLGGSDRGTPAYLDLEQPPITNATAIAYFQSWRKQIESSQPPAANITHALIAAGLFSCGHGEELGEILRRAPAQTVRLDHGAGHCTQAPFRTVMRLVPLPAHLATTEVWFKDSPLLNEILEWWQLAQPMWDEEHRRYILHVIP